jgi:hypothetical protein
MTINKLVIILSLLLASCSPQKKLAKLMKEHPELFKDKVTVTVRHDTLISKEIHKDSVINNIYSKDTVYIKEGRETVKYVYEQGSKAYISADVKADTIIKIVTDTVKSRTIIKEVKAPKTGFEIFSEWAIIIILIVVVGKYIGLPLLKMAIPKLPL